MDWERKIKRKWLHVCARALPVLRALGSFLVGEQKAFAPFDRDGPVSKTWNSPWAGVPLWLTGAWLTVYWLFCVPPPGYAIGALAVVAGIMSVRDIKILGKITWVILLVCLLITEFRAINKDRADNDAKQQAFFSSQRIGFGVIADGLKVAISNSQTQFEKTMKEAEKVSGETEEATQAATKAANQTTGGDSFAYVKFPSVYYPPLYATVLKVGEAPLYDVNVRVTEFTHCQNLPILSSSVPCIARYPLGEKEVGNMPIGSSFNPRGGKNFDLTALPKPSSGGPGDLDHISLLIEIDARNGAWEEMYWIHRLPTVPHAIRLEQALRVYKRTYDTQGTPTGLRVVYSEVPPDYPKELLEFDPAAPMQR